MWNANALLQPIRPDQPAGDDLSFSRDFDAIAEARRFDDPSIDQGEWQTDIKEADWDKAIKLTTALLQSQSKDLRLAVWLTEASTHVYGFKGLAEGFKLVAGLCDHYWDSVYPEADGDDYDLRAGNLGWLVARAEPWLKNIPLTEGRGIQYSYTRITDARNRAQHKDSNDKSNHPELSPEAIDSALRNSSPGFYDSLVQDAQTCAAAIGQLQTAIDARLGLDGPGFSGLKQCLDDILHLVGRSTQDLGLVVTGLEDVAGETTQPVQAAPIYNSSGAIRSRTDALNQLKAVARYFRETEPHSPVAYLADKAAYWGNLPLHDWLRTVIKDDASLSHVEELLGIAKQGNDGAS